MPVDPEELNRALDEGERPDMPDNVPPGWLGETPVDLRKVDPESHGDNAGLVQESGVEVRFLVIVLAALLVVTAPVALWLIWRERKWATWFRWAMTAAVLVYLGLLGWAMLR